MRLKSVFIVALGLYLFAANQLVFAALPKDPCDVPTGLHEELSKKYPAAHLVSLADLDEHRQKLFQKDFGSRCPGLVRVNFYGDGKPTWAVVLISGENPKRKAELVVARPVTNGWEIRSLESTDGTPVVSRQPPGKYEDLYGEKKIQATHPVIMFVAYESWAVVFAWTGKDVDKVQVSD
jgi:hypothetical protein